MEFKKIFYCLILLFSLVFSASVSGAAYVVTVKNNTQEKLKAWIGNARFTAPAGQGTSLQPILEPGAVVNLSLPDGSCASRMVYLQKYNPVGPSFDPGVYLTLPLPDDKSGYTCRSFTFSINTAADGNLSVGQ